MKKSLLTLLVFLVTIPYLTAATVKGRVLNNEMQPIDYVNVILKKEGDASVIKGGITDTDGFFSIEQIAIGEYTLDISFIGYTTYTRNIRITQTDQILTLGALKLKEDATALAEVEVVGQASQMRFDIDKKVFNVDQNLASAGASASEVLENIPSVQVDNDGNISLRNNSSVEIWINGKPSGLNEENRAQILEQMPAGSIESIEVITNPSAKFSPEGTAGIINLVMKKDRKKGYFGSLTAGTDYQLFGKTSNNISANFNYNSSKIDFYANVGFQQQSRIGGGYTDRYSFTPNTDWLDTISYMHQTSYNDRGSLGVFARTGIDWHIDTKNTLGISGIFNSSWDKNSSTINYQTIRFDQFDTTIYKNDNIVYADRLSYNITLNYTHAIDTKGSEVRSSLAYNNNMRDQESDYLQTVTSGRANGYTQEQYSGFKNHSAEFKSDYTQKLFDNMKVETGAALNWQNRFSNSKTWDYPTPDAQNLSAYNDFGYQEWIAAVYATYGAKFKKFSFSAGLRGEYTNTTVSTRDAETENYIVSNKDYFQLYPTAYVSYSLPKDNELQLNYTRRVNRPRGRQLSAFRNVSDSTNISYGNPNLNPEFANAIEFNYIKSWEEHMLSTSLYYRYTTNIIQQVRFQSPQNNEIMETTYDNVASSQSVGVELVGKNRLWKFLNLTTTLNFYYQAMSPIIYQNVLLEKATSGLSWDARIMANFLFTKTFTGQITGSYNSPRVIAQGRTKEMYSIDLGLRKSFLEKMLNLSFTIRDVLNSRGWKNTTWGDSFYQDFEQAPIGSRFSLSLTYNFGNMKGKKEKKTSREENGNNSTDSGEDFME